MATDLKEQPLKRRPAYTNIHVTQIISYRLPPAAWSSILHRISGALMFLLLPLVIWLFDTSLGSEVSYERFRSAFAFGAVGLPGWIVKLVTFGLIWAYLYHFCAGMRHVWMDLTHSVSQKFGHVSAIVAMALSTVVALALGVKLSLGAGSAMSTSFGSRRLVVGAHYGLRDWMAQRVTSLVMAVFTVAVVVQVLMPGSLDYYKWSGMFSQQWMKVLTFVTIVAMLWHVWVGMRDIWMDYVKPVTVRLALDVFTIAWLLGCAGWAIQVLWRL